MLGMKSEALDLARFSLKKAAATFETAHTTYYLIQDDSSTSQVELDLVLQAGADLALSVADIASVTGPVNKAVPLTTNELQGFELAISLLTSFREPVKTLLGDDSAREVNHASAIPVASADE